VKNVVVLGSAGMLGHRVHKVLARLPGIQAWGTRRHASKNSENHELTFDVKEGIPALERLAEQIGGCHYFINCIAALKSDIDEGDPSSAKNATIVNAFFPHELALVAKKFGAHVIHVSTDGVFSGLSDKPYLESHAADATDLYGRTKLMGEVIADSFISIRSSFVGFDPGKHRGILEWFLAQPEGSRLSGYAEQKWTGVTTLQFAQLCAKIILGGDFRRLRNESPIHHFAPNDALSKYELLILFRKIFNRNVEIASVPSPTGTLSRVLSSRYKGLRDVFGRASMEQALLELASESED